MTTMRARVHWVPEAEGGRHTMPRGPSYSTVAKFEELADRWPREAWSVVLAFDEEPQERDLIARIRLLVPETAPPDLLRPGARFELFEGSRLVAVGEVLDS